MARKVPTRHGRQRFTPRRWLPFAAAIAVVGGLVFVANNEEPPAPVGAAALPAAARLPVASEPGAVSSSFYCAGGTAVGSSGVAELSVLIANADRRGTTAEVEVIGSNGERRRITVAVPAHGGARVTAREHLIAPWAAMTVEVLGGRATVEREVSGPDGYDTTPCSSRAGTTWYVPFGSTVLGAQASIALFNPFPDDTSVDISFATSSGSRKPLELQGLTVPARSVRVVDVNKAVARRDQVSATVVARTGRLVVDRVQRHDGTGEPVVGTGAGQVRTEAPKGLASTPALPALSDRWVLPNLRVSEGARPEIVVFNPSGRAARVDVVVRYEEPDRYPALEPVELTIRPGEPAMLDLTDLPDVVPDVGMSVDVRSLDGVAIAAEGVLYRNDPSPSLGVTIVPGSPVGATRWFLASEGTGGRRLAKIVVLNPTASSVTVWVDELVEGARTNLGSATVRIPGGDRRTLDVDAGTSGVPLVIGASGPVVVQRSASARTGVGISFSLGTPFPETVTDLPSPS